MTKKKKAVIRQKILRKVSSQSIFVICLLLFFLFLVVMVTGRQQNFKEQAQGITPSFTSLGDCNANGTCPTSMVVSTTINPPISQITQAPCVSTQSQPVVVAASKRRHFSGNMNFFRQLLNLFLQLLQELMQLLGGNNLNTNPPTSNVVVTPSTVQPSGSIDNTQPMPCAPTAGATLTAAPLPTATVGTNPSAIPSGSTAPSGTKQTITAYGFGGSAAYQSAGSPWWVLNNAWGGPPPNTQAIDYYQNSFPNNTTMRWTYGGSGGNVLGYPEIIIGDQNGQSVKSLNGVEPAWYGKTLGSLSHFIISWDIVINSKNGDNWDILFENHMMGHETGIILKNPGWFRGGTNFSNLGGISGVGIPNAWASGSFAIVPDTVMAGTPMLKGSIDLLPIFKWAISNGWMTSNEPIYGWEFGVEPTNGSGSVTFNSVSVNIQ